VAAEMYEMSQPQMERALEFNEGCWANTWTKGTGVSITSISRDIIEIEEVARIEPVTDIQHDEELKETIPQADTEEQPLIAEALLPETKHPPKEENSKEIDNFAQEVNTLENMDMELMESRVRESFRDVIKELDLEYLITDTKNEKKRTRNIND
jgi:hypothetical protein